ncbi:hypothetical protein RI129_010758 [Pyrocoelia pectoralis]|uniref:Probable ATP-dependent RNA helicase spindle-E n=1 Tax=Pyrocoelia pectoralis TaxID=417401 RepID=A0AAN7ZDX3_9COLE
MEVIITTFCNPLKFWVFEVSNRKQRETFEQKLDQGNFARITSPSVGQLALIHHKNKWKRALVQSDVTPFTCWLIDYGMEHSADSVYEIPPAFECPIPLTKKAALNDVACLQRDCTPSGVRTIGDINFSYGSNKRMHDYLENAERILFACHREIGNTHLGEITIITSNSSFELTEVLVKEEVLIRDTDTFIKALKINGSTEEFALLKTASCNSKSIKEAFGNELTVGVGRGCSRSLRSPNSLPISPIEVDNSVNDSLYSDADRSPSQMSNLSHSSDNSIKRSTKIKRKLEEFLSNNKESKEEKIVSVVAQNEVVTPRPHLNNKSDDEVSSTADYHSREMMRKYLNNNCTCDQCEGWSEGNFFFNPRKKASDVKAKSYKDVKPELLLKTEEKSGVLAKITSPHRSQLTKIERSVKPTVLVHSTTILTPATTPTAAPFHKDIHKALRSYEHVYTIQGYVWPAIMRHMNVCIISKRDSGKTLAYLPAICSFELERQERYPDLPRSTVSPISVILCPGIEVAEKVYYLILKLLENASQKSYVALAIQPVDKNCLKQFERKVDILVATPVTLLSLLSSRIITLKRLCHLVIEKANIILERFSTEMGKILNVVQSMLSHRSCNYTVQMILTSEKWTRSIENLLKSLLIMPIVCIGSYLEAAMYGRVDIRVQFLEAQAKIRALIKILKGKSKICRTIIICNTDDEIKEAKPYLLMEGIDCLYITEDMEMAEINGIESVWLKTTGGKHLALFCTENVFNCNITITDAVMLINYSLPETWTQFVNRFRCMIDNYCSPLVLESSDNWTQCTVDIFMDESCSKQFPKVVQLMKRLGGKLTPDFLNYYKKTLQDVEAEKLKLKVDVCTNLKLFGKCERTSCEQRHVFSNEEDYVSNLPKNGTIKFRIARVHDVTSFGIKIIEVRDRDGKLCEWELYKELQTELNEAMGHKKQCVFDVDVGSWYVYHSLSADTYLRCCVLKIVDVEPITKRPVTVSVRCLDTGIKFDVGSSFLYKLPLQFQKIPPQVIDVYLANVVPPDFDETWSYYCKSKVESLLKQADYNHENAFVTGQILLQLTDKLWLKNITVHQQLKSDDFAVIKLNLRKTLVEQNIVNVNENQLHLLYKLCKKSKIALPCYEVNVKPVKVKSQPEFQWAHFSDADCIQIFISYVDSPSLFYARIVKYYDVFEDLQDEIQENLQKPNYPEVGVIFVNKCCLVKDSIGDTYTRCIVTEVMDDVVNVFLVDYGNHATVKKSELQHLPDEYITRLPFQAIECRLYGIEPDWDVWDKSANERLRDFMFEPEESYFRILHMNIYKKEEAVATGGLKYAVLLADDFNGDLVVLNKLLIDEGKAAIVHEEDVGEFQLQKPSSDEDEKDSLPEIEREMTFDEISREQKHHTTNGCEEFSSGAVDETSDEPVWDIVINQKEEFFKELLGVSDTKLPNTSSSTVPALPPINTTSSQDHYTPKVIWYQTETHVKLKVAVPCIDKCEISVVRKNALMFEGITTDGRPYKVNLFLHDHVLKEIEHKITGQDVKIRLTKMVPARWPRLVLSGERDRHISYNYTKYDEEDEEKERKFLDLGGDHPDEIIDENDEECVYYTGSEDSGDSDSIEFDC